MNYETLILEQDVGSACLTYNRLNILQCDVSRAWRRSAEDLDQATCATQLDLLHAVITGRKQLPSPQQTMGTVHVE